MPLDPDMQALLAVLAHGGASELSSLSIAEARAHASELRVAPGPRARVDECSMPGPGGALVLRVYRPEQLRQALGALVYFAGGGYVVGDVPGHDALCRELATGGDCAVVSVAHRLAPEHRFPAAVEDAYAATCWLHEHADTFGIDHRRVAVGGDSTGATLATVVARLAKERRNPALVFQLLLYPITDLHAFDGASSTDQPAGAILTPASANWFAAAYLRGPADRDDPRCSPRLARNLIGLPPVLMITADEDPSRADAHAYALALRAAHVDVSLSNYDGVVHGFVSMHAYLKRGRDALLDCQRALRAALGTQSG